MVTMHPGTLEAAREGRRKLLCGRRDRGKGRKGKMERKRNRRRKRKMTRQRKRKREREGVETHKNNKS